MRRGFGCFPWGLAVLGVALGAAYWYAGRVVERRIEREVAARLPIAIGMKGDYKVTASAGLAGAARGRIESVKIEGRDVRLKNGVNLKQLDTTLRGISVDRSKRSIERIEKAEFTASISGDELNAFLARQYPDIADRAATLHDGYVTVTAQPRIRGTRVPVEAEAALEIENGTRLILRVREVSSGAISSPAIARNYIEHKLNPVLDLPSLGFKGKVTSVTIKPDAITLSGEGEPGALARL